MEGLPGYPVEPSGSKGRGVIAAPRLVPRRGKALVQFSFIDALVAGLYDGAFPASEVLAAGTLGVGCGDALDGELVYFDGSMVLCRGDGSIVAVDPADLLPFAEVADFAPTYTRRLGRLEEGEFERLVDSVVPSGNLFYAIRLDGQFERVAMREAVRQQRPFRGLVDAVRDQSQSTVDTTTGTIVGFKGPDVFQGLSVADFHLHYLDDARTVGGHVLDFVLSTGTVSIEAYSTLTVHLPEVESYLDAELDDVSADEQIRRAEGT